jgi:RNA polymerase sigma-54 factor
MKSPELALTLRPEQRMLLLPRMLQALDVLQLPRLALDDMVATALAENEALAVRRQSQPKDRAASGAGRSARAREASDRHEQFLRSRPARGGSLRDQVISQLWLVDAPPRVAELLRSIVESLDERGLRTVTDAELAVAIDPPAAPEELVLADAELRKLEPRGVGARTAVDAMLCQLSPTDADRPLVEAILRDHLDDLARHRRGIVASALAVSAEELDLLLEKIRQLSPRPSAGFDDGPSVTVRPDLVVRRAAKGVEIEPVDPHAIALEIDPQILEWSKDRGAPAEVRNYLRERIEAAKSLLQCLDQRRATLERVARALFLRQAEFLEQGPRFLRPLRMQDLAESLGIHPSTISRAVAGKYAETDWGIYRLRDFFEVGVATTTGEAGSRANLRDAIRQLFAGEAPGRPLDDDAVVARLKVKGYVLARRTVAKYRAELGIPSSWHRRRAKDVAPEPAVEATSARGGA